jgi:type IV pilus assembly protein PilN
MIKINLLPWREELRKEKQKAFNDAFVLSICITAGLFAGVHLYIADLQNFQAQRNQLLQNEIAILDQQIADIKNIEDKKTHLINKITVIHNLQRSRPEIVHLFNEIPRATPDGLFMTKLTRTGRDLTFEGKSQSNALVSAFMSSIQNSPWLQTPSLDIIQADKVTNDKNNSLEKMNDFTLRTKQSDLPDVK